MSVPIFLSEIVRTIIIMTVSGGAVALLLFAIKPLVRNRLPKSAQYYFWIVALFTLLIPVSRVVILPAQVGGIAPAPVSAVVERSIVTVAEENQRMVYRTQANAHIPSMPGMPSMPEMRVNIPILPIDNMAMQPAATLPPTPEVSPSVLAVATTAFMLVYPLAVLVVLAYNLIGYTLFARKLHRGYIAPYKEELDLLAEVAGQRRIPRMFISDHVATPMLIGLFKPTIVLPNCNYTGEQLRSILLHELTHMRRFDIAVKWMSLLACSIHWFNPLVWFARREIDSICELSCDEAVISNMDVSGKQIYGNTLIDVASDTRIPLPVLSTTMCEEKRALKERLSAIMKSKKHTKLAAFVSTLIILVAALGACGLGASRNTGNDDGIDNGYTTEPTTTTARQEPNNTAPPVTMALATPQDIAELFVGNVMQTIVPPHHVTVVDYRVDHMRKVAELSDGLPFPVELWEIFYMFQVEHEPFIIWSGANSHPDEDGWVGPHVFHDFATHLVIAAEGGGVSLLGPVGWGTVGIHSAQADTPWGADILLRQYLEHIGLLPPVTFPGNHYIAYVYLGDEFYMRALLSQPVVQGDGGVWAVERWQSLDRWNAGVAFPPPVISETQTMIEFFEELQQMYAPGMAFYNTETALNNFLLPWKEWNEDVRVIGVYPVPENMHNPLDMPVRHSPVFPEEPGAFSNHGDWNWPMDYTRHGPSPYWDLREQILEELGGLAFDEAYHFRMGDGGYALITGWRPMLTYEEFTRYYPDFYLPQQAGDFRLVGVNVNDLMSDAIRVYSRPVPSAQRIPHIHLYAHTDLPINEVFTRNMHVFSFLALYVNSAGDYVGIGVSTAGPEGAYSWINWMPHEVVTVNSHGDFYFIGARDRYAAAIFESIELSPVYPFPTVLEIGFVNPEHMQIEFWGWASSRNFTENEPASREELSELIRIFNPEALVEGFNGHIMSFVR